MAAQCERYFHISGARNDWQPINERLTVLERQASSRIDRGSDQLPFGHLIDT